MPPFVPLEEMLAGSDRLHSELARCIGDLQIQTDHRADVSSVLATLVIEHAHSILLLVMENKPSSALALIRVQYEALLRAFWLYFAASDSIVERCVKPLPSNTTKEPDLFPTITEMLVRIEGKAPATVVRALSDFKSSAWGAMNSFVHGNLRPMIGHRNGYHPGLLSQTIQNSNCSAMFATMLLGQVTNRADLVLAVVSKSSAYARFLPPLNFPASA